MPTFEMKLVYVIEDDAITAAITKVLLAQTLPDTPVFLYANGQRALDQLAWALHTGAALPDLILLDLDMPVLDGWEFLAAFSRLPLTHPVCVVLLTSSINPADRARAARDPAVAGYFAKPLDARSVARLLRVRRAARGPGAGAPNFPGDLHYLVYQSRATVPFDDWQLAQLLTQSRAYNATHGLTGLLLYGEGSIMQVLEGTQAHLRAVFARIAQDPRHGEVIKLADGPALHRVFTHWSMGFRTGSPADFKCLTGYVNPDHPQYLRGEPGQPAAELHALLAGFISSGVN